FACERGVNKTYLIDPKLNNREQAAKIREALGYSPYRVFECSGVESSVNTAIHAVRNGGTVVLVGMGKPQISIPVSELIIRQISFKGMFRYRDTWARAIRLIENGQINVKDLVTHRFDLKDAVSAFETAANPQSQSVKVLILG
ncbi:L-arabinitol 4-dehydrogenase, partial [Spiromyces aspiralis]